MVALIYSPTYSLALLGLVHDFDGTRARRALEMARTVLGKHAVDSLLLRWAEKPLQDDQLLLAHTRDYVRRFRTPANISRVVEVDFIRNIPQFFVDRLFTDVALIGAAGTVAGAEIALKSGLAINLFGGFHHAKPSAGEGYCLVSDIAIAIAILRVKDLLAPQDCVVYVDTDAHMGNGVAHEFKNDSRVKIFDMFNCGTYPCVEDSLYPYDYRGDFEALERIDLPIPLRPQTGASEYLSKLKAALPIFVSGIQTKNRIGLAVYNAGTDVLDGDKQGGLCLSYSAAVERDMFVLQELRSRGIPTLMLPSGGYSDLSYRALGGTLIAAIRAFSD